MIRYLIPTTMESGPVRCLTYGSRNPPSRIHPIQYAAEIGWLGLVEEDIGFGRVGVLTLVATQHSECD
jgi:hypothetical protein